MGAASSININFDIYISYPENNEFIQTMEKDLRNLNYEVIDSSIITKSFTELSNTDISNSIEIVIEKAKYIFVCISHKTIKTITQMIEMNEILQKLSDVSGLQKKLIYFMLNRDYTPNTNTELKSIIQNNKWFPLYDENTLFETTSKVLTILMNE